MRSDGMLTTSGERRRGHAMTGICFAAVMFGACSSKGASPAGGDKTPAPVPANEAPERCCCKHSDESAEPGARTVLIVTEDGLYLEGAMLTMADIEVAKLTPAEYAADPARAYAEVQVVVFDDYTPAEVPPVHAIYFHPDQAGSPILVTGTLERPPQITEIAEDHPVLRGVTLEEVSFGATRVFAPRGEDGEIALAKSIRDVVIAARSVSDRKIVEVGFSLGDSDLVLRTAFPLLLVNTLEWFASEDTARHRFELRSVAECEGAGGVCVAMEGC